VLLHLDGNSGAYTDRSGTKAVLGSRQYSGYGRAFNVRMPPLTPPRDARLGTFPYGVFGLTGKDSNGDRDFTDAGDVDPVRLMGAMRSDGVYNLAISPTLGRISNEREIIRILESARDRRLKLILRATELTVTSSTLTISSGGPTVTRKSRDEGLYETEFLNGPDILASTASSDVYTMNAAATDRNLQRFKRIFTQRPDLKPMIHSWYSLDEPMARNMSLAELQKIFRAHKAIFPLIPVFICYNQSPAMPDRNRDGMSDGMLGQPENPYGPGGAQIFFGTTLTGASGANSTFGSVTIRGGVMTATEVMAWTTGRHLTYAPTRSALSAPWNGAAFRDRTPTLDWSGSRGAIRYQVRVSSYVSLRRPVRDVVLARTAYTTPTALVAGKTYYWRVRALDEYGRGTWSPVRRFTVRK